MAQAAGQIVASAGQQATGMVQINQAIQGIDESAKQNMASVQQVEQTAQNLNALSVQLSQLTAEEQVDGDGQRNTHKTAPGNISRGTG